MDIDRLKIRSIEDLRRFIKEFFKEMEVEVFLFGSRATKDYSRYSDIDIGFLSKQDIKRDLTVLRELLEESNFPYKVDLVDLSENNRLLEIVLKEGKKWI